MDLRLLATPDPESCEVPTAAQVSCGGLVKEIHVVRSPAKMASLGVGLKNGFAALQSEPLPHQAGPA